MKNKKKYKSSSLLRQRFWAEQTFWSDGYFACSTGDTIKYLNTNGEKRHEDR